MSVRCSSIIHYLTESKLCKEMINRRIVKKAIKCTLDLDKTSDLTPVKPEDFRSFETSMLIFDIFGGEILKTHY